MMTVLLWAWVFAIPLWVVGLMVWEWYQEHRP